MNRSSDHLPELDGLRGVAIALVMLVHFTTLNGLSGWDYPFQVTEAFAWIGVDLFFVLSGFLITGILVDSRNDPNGMIYFYGRRALRILPVYYGLLFLYTVVFPLLLPAGHGILPAVWVTDPGWYWTFLSNFLFVQLGRFPDEVMAVSWSLAVEEQFYLVWPWIVRSLDDKSLEKFCWGALGFTAVLRVGLLAAGWEGVPIYVFTPARLDGLAVGALLALWRRTPEGSAKLRRWRKPACQYGFAALLACLVADAFLADDPTAERWLVLLSFPTLAFFFGGVLAFSLESAGEWGRFLRWRPLCLLGIWSFPIYLLNNAIAEGARRLGYDPNLLTTPASRWAGQIAFYIVVGGACIALGALFHYALERPAQKLKNKLPRAPIPWRLFPTR